MTNWIEKGTTMYSQKMDAILGELYPYIEQSETREILIFNKVTDIYRLYNKYNIGPYLKYSRRKGGKNLLNIQNRIIGKNLYIVSSFGIERLLSTIDRISIIIHLVGRNLTTKFVIRNSSGALGPFIVHKNEDGRFKGITHHLSWKDILDLLNIIFTIPDMTFADVEKYIMP